MCLITPLNNSSPLTVTPHLFLCRFDQEEIGDAEDGKPMKNEMASCANEICSDHWYIIRGVRSCVRSHYEARWVRHFWGNVKVTVVTGIIQLPGTCTPRFVMWYGNVSGKNGAWSYKVGPVLCKNWLWPWIRGWDFNQGKYLRKSSESPLK